MVAGHKFEKGRIGGHAAVFLLVLAAVINFLVMVREGALSSSWCAKAHYSYLCWSETPKDVDGVTMTAGNTIAALPK